MDSAHISPSLKAHVEAIESDVVDRLLREACAFVAASAPGTRADTGRILCRDAVLAAVQLVVSDPALVARAVQAATAASAHVISQQARRGVSEPAHIRSSQRHHLVEQPQPLGV
jgi:hypothetical protein